MQPDVSEFFFKHINALRNASDEADARGYRLTEQGATAEVTITMLRALLARDFDELVARGYLLAPQKG